MSAPDGLEERERLSPTDFSSAVSAITSAFGDPTRREIYLFAHDSTAGVTASEVAQHFELHANVARHHLDKLAAGGYLDVATVRASGAGRPSKRYRASDDHMPFVMPVRHDDIVINLLGRALSELGEERASAIAEEVGVSYGRSLAASLGDAAAGQRSVRAALHAVADSLAAHGFATKAEHHGDELRIVSDHCPFGDAPAEHPVICAVDRGIVSGMLEALYGETPVDLLSTIPRGDDRCVTSVDSAPLGSAPLGSAPLDEASLDDA